MLLTVTFKCKHQKKVSSIEFNCIVYWGIKSSGADFDHSILVLFTYFVGLNPNKAGKPTTFNNYFYDTAVYRKHCYKISHLTCMSKQAGVLKIHSQIINILSTGMLYNAVHSASAFRSSW